MEADEKEHIRKNLPNLLSLTNCTPMFLAHLHADGQISAEEEEILSNLKNIQERSKRFYDIIQTRSKSFNCLKQALKDTSQTGALAILEDCPKQNDTLFKIVGSIAFCKTELLGRGALNTRVYKGKYGWRDVAVKMISTDDIEKDIVMQEVEFLKELDWHENIVRYFEQAVHKNFILIALELCDTDLHKYVLKQDSASETKFNIDVQDIIKQVTSGIEHLHRNKVVHRDLKPANILIVRQATGDVRIKISDFGTAKKMPNERSTVTVHTSGVGTEGWMAPEVLAKQLEEESGNIVEKTRLTSSSDIFSLGCIFYFVLTDGTHPFGNHFRRQVNIMDGKYNLKEEKIKCKIPTMTIDTIQLIERMISHQDVIRPTATEVVKRLVDLSRIDSDNTQTGNLGNHQPTLITQTTPQPTPPYQRGVGGREVVREEGVAVEDDGVVTAFVPQEYYEDEVVEINDYVLAIEEREIPQVEAMFYFLGHPDPCEFEVKKDEVMFLLAKSNSDWWNVRKANGEDGFVPANYVKEVESKVVRVQFKKPQFMTLDVSKVKTRMVLTRETKVNETGSGSTDNDLERNVPTKNACVAPLPPSQSHHTGNSSDSLKEKLGVRRPIVPLAPPSVRRRIPPRVGSNQR